MDLSGYYDWVYGDKPYGQIQTPRPGTPPTLKPPRQQTVIHAATRSGLRRPSQTVRWVRLVLTKRQLYVARGSRYMTRADVRAVLTRQTNVATVRNNGSQRYPKQQRRFGVTLTDTSLRIGCHLIAGPDFRTLIEWATWP